jgi:hypothetical protein
MTARIPGIAVAKARTAAERWLTQGRGRPLSS